MAVSSIETRFGNVSVWDNRPDNRPSIVMLHPHSGCKEMYAPLIASLTEYRCIAIDLPGHGNSDKAKDPHHTYTIEGYANAILDVTNALQLKNFSVIGWSLGGHIALSLLNKTDKIRALILSGTPPTNVPEDLSRAYKRNFSSFNQTQLTEDEAKTFMQECGFTSKVAVQAALKCDAAARQRIWASLNEGIGGSQRALVETNDTPLLIIQGGADNCVNGQYFSRIQYANACVVTLAQDATHAVLETHAQACAVRISDFLQFSQFDHPDLAFFPRVNLGVSKFNPLGCAARGLCFEDFNQIPPYPHEMIAHLECQTCERRSPDTRNI